ncbi:MAG: hypothetical protein ABI655_04480 [Phenylobacterium sp.]
MLSLGLILRPRPGPMLQVATQFAARFVDLAVVTLILTVLT